MNTRNRIRILVGGLLAYAAMAPAQTPPAPPAPAAPPAPMVAPRPPAPPADSFLYAQGTVDADLQMKLDEARAKAQEKMAEAMEKVREKEFLFKPDISAEVMAKVQTSLDMALAQVKPIVNMGGFGKAGRGQSEDRLYESGQRLLDARRWDEALASFTDVANRQGNRADGALYWKAYALNKLGRRDDALAAIADLRKSYPSSRWLEDARALEVEVRQNSGQAVTAESETNEEMKLLALNGIMQNDPERALPTLEAILKGTQSPKVKERTLFVLAQSSAPRARQALEQVARGSGNPDLQVKAINYIGVMRRNSTQDSTPMLAEIYGSSNDVTVKRAILSAFFQTRQRDRLFDVAKNEKTADLRLEAIRMLGSLGSEATAGLVPVYSAESDGQVKTAIADAFVQTRNAKSLVEITRAEKDASMKKELVRRLSSMKSQEATDYLMELLK